MEIIKEPPLKISTSFYKQLTSKISLVNKRLLNETIQPTALKKLEKEALRGSTTERPEPQPKPKSISRPNYLSLILKSEHKVNSNTCIVKLPKMPFGKHKDYNEDPKFVASHFLDTHRNMTGKQSEELAEITRKFRLQAKQQTKRNNTGNSKPRYIKEFDVYDMEHGELKCEKNKIVIKSYMNDKAKYRKYLYESESVRESRKGLSKKTQEQSVERLHNSFKQNESNLASFFVTKYSRLFSRESGLVSHPKIPNLDLTVLNL